MDPQEYPLFTKSEAMSQGGYVLMINPTKNTAITD